MWHVRRPPNASPRSPATGPSHFQRGRTAWAPGDLTSISKVVAWARGGLARICSRDDAGSVAIVVSFRGWNDPCKVFGAC
jgi:hypothetical protein